MPGSSIDAGRTPDPLQLRREMLQRCALFRGLPEDVLGELAVASQPTRFSLTRMRVGVPSALFVVGAGRARLVRSVGARTVTLHYVGAGEVFGEACLTHPDERSELLVLDALDALRVSVGIMERLLERHPATALALLQVQQTRRCQLEERLTAFVTRTVEARVADFLTQAAERHGITDSRGDVIGEKFTHLEIAECVGATRETVTLVLGVLKRDGLIETDHRRIVVRDVDALRQRATATVAS